MAIYHFIGIKGTGMSALAHVMYDMGYHVQGSDVDKQFFTQHALKEKNIPIFSFSASNIEPGQIIIAGNAFPENHEEIEAAKALGLQIYRYHHFLGDLLSHYTSVAVTGSHGKTSTTGLLSHVLEEVKPTSYLIGDGTGKGAADSEYFVFEACEYRRHFLAYEPDYAIMTNIDFDHPDYFEDIDDVYQAFQTMAMQVKKAIIAYGDDPYLQRIQANVPVVFYGFEEDNDFRATNIDKNADGTTFDVFVRNTFYGSFTIAAYGDHSILNTLAVIALAEYEQAPVEVIQEALKGFKGVKRRFTENHIDNQIMIDDYAHHPVEIKATIQAAKQKYHDRPIVAIFQPHTFTRTKTFLDEFAESLSDADMVYLCDIFGSAREKSEMLTIQDLQKKVTGATLLTEETITQLKAHENGVLLFMGAGDIQKYEKAYEQTIS